MTLLPNHANITAVYGFQLYAYTTVTNSVFQRDMNSF